MRTDDLDPPTILAGAAAALALVVPTAIAVLIVDRGDDDGSAWTLLALAVFLAGFFLGGAVAARRAPHLPLAHGAIAAATAFLVVQVVGTARRLAAGDDVTWVLIVFNALVAASVGLLGALVAGRRRPG
jgi:putative membrane protein (TIGR04086 family)